MHNLTGYLPGPFPLLSQRTLLYAVIDIFHTKGKDSLSPSFTKTFLSLEKRNKTTATHRRRKMQLLKKGNKGRDYTSGKKIPSRRLLVIENAMKDSQ